MRRGALAQAGKTTQYKHTQTHRAHTHTHTCTLARCAHSAHTCHTARNLALKRRSMEGGFLYIPYKKTQRQVREMGREGRETGLVGRRHFPYSRPWNFLFGENLLIDLHDGRLDRGLLLYLHSLMKIEVCMKLA